MSSADEGGVRRLPTGAHGIPADVVARNQRERLIAATAEACGEGGYAETSVAELAHRAGVSTATFYKLFAGKLECALEAHRELSGRLLEEVDRACARAGEAKVRAAVRTLLDLLAADAPTARLLTIEVLALGPAGAKRNDATIEDFAARLRAGRQVSNAEWSMVAGIAMLIGKRVMAGEAAGLPELEDELVAMLT
ncbi:MAG TPA: helix-turn-helix domain-containing protein [Solirubrobacterales bacterium]|jgi:AcrR family transcriptional regulator|nr:helix-turn-helix domain-containing protein [Solirubrobacterales bacterium]